MTDVVGENSNKTFMQYLEEQGFDVETIDSEGTTGTVIIKGKKYSVATNFGTISSEYVGEATEAELNKPKFESVTPVVEGNTINVAATLKNPEGVSLSYSIKKEIDENYGEEQSSSTFTNLQAGTTYVIKVTATNEEGQTTIRTLKAKTLSLAELTGGKASFSISPDTKWQASTTATINSTYTLGANEELRYRIGSSGEFKKYTGPFEVRENTSLYGIFYNTVTSEVGYTFTLSDINIIDKEAPTVTVTESAKASKTITVNVSATDAKIGMPNSPTYTYYISADSSDYGSPVQPEITGNAVKFTGLQPNTTYYIKVVTEDRAENKGIGYATIKTEDFVYVSKINLSDTSKTIGLETVIISVTSVESARTGVEPTNPSVTWSIEDSDKVRIDSQTETSVTITGLEDTGVNTVAITATANDGSGVTETCNVAVWNGTYIYTAEDLDLIDDNTTNLAKNYKLMADIDLQDKPYDRSVITGTFNGHFDGNGYTIYNLIINSTASGNPDVAFFIALGNGAIVENLTFDNPYVHNEYGKRASVITASNAQKTSGSYTIRNCHVINCDVKTTTQYAGAIDSYQYNANSIIENCSATGNISSSFGSSYYLIGSKGHNTDASVCLKGSSFTGTWNGTAVDVSF